MSKQITTATQLDNLDPQSVVRLASGQVFVRTDQTAHGCDWQGVGSAEYWYPEGVMAEHEGPVTVIWTPRVTR